MKKLLLIVFVISNHLAAQDNMDSLRTIWLNESSADTIRLGAIHRMAWQNYLSGQADSALFYAQLQSEFAKKKGQLRHLADAQYTKGLAYSYLGNYSSAIESYKDCLAQYELLGFRNDMTTILYCLGNVYQIQGESEQALAYFKEGLEIQNELDNKRIKGVLLNSIGSLHHQQGNYEEAINYFNDALDLQNVDKGTEDIRAAILTNLGNVFMNQGEYAKALEYFQESLSLYRDVSYLSGVAGSLNNIGVLHEKRGAYSKALYYYKESLEIEQQRKNNFGVARVYGNIGNIYRTKGELKLSAEYHKKSQEIAEQLDDKEGLLNTLINRGGVCTDREEFDQAIAFYESGLALAKELKAKGEESSCLANMSLVYFAVNEYKTSIKYGKEALTLAQEVGTPSLKCSALRNLFLTYSELDSVATAAEQLLHLIDIRNKELKSNFSILSEEEKDGYFSTMTEDYDHLYAFADQHYQNYPELLTLAFNHAMLSKGILLKSSKALRNSILSSKDTILIQQYQDWLVMKRKAAQLLSTGNDIHLIEQEIQQLETELIKKSQAFDEVKHLEMIHWKDVQSNLKPDEAAIEFIQYRQKDKSVIYSALVLLANSKRPQIIRLCEESEIASIIGHFESNSIDHIERIYGTRNEPKSELYELIWEPLERQLKESKQVFISPVGLLHKISFHALSNKKGERLGNDLQLVHLSSLHELRNRNQDNEPDISTIALFGGIDYAGGNEKSKEIWKYLEGSLEETSEIERILKEQDYTIRHFVKSSASEEQFKEIAPEAGIFHIATHGFFYQPTDDVLEELIDTTENIDDLSFRGETKGGGLQAFVENQNPLMRSGLVLAGANGAWSETLAEREDGVLTAAEVITIDMRKTELIVLSACETGLGDIRGSEGVYGLRRAFKIAGVNKMIISLWKVPDQETAEFMSCFYKHFVESKDIRQSFIQTQHNLSKKYDPYFWAAFVLIE